VSFGQDALMIASLVNNAGVLWGVVVVAIVVVFIRLLGRN
jgi:hypothetical protein